MTTTDYGLPRRMWHQLEPIHALFWYAPEVFEVAAAFGYDVATRWPSYFAWRSAPLGAAGPKLVGSAFYSFSPQMVAEHVPAAWAVASPRQVLSARTRAADRMCLALFGDLIGTHGLAEAADLAREAALAADTAGRTLAAANADLPWPGEPHAAMGAAPAEVFASRGWTASQWSAARDRLAARGWVDADGRATVRGRDGRDEIEWRTDRLADAPWRALGADRAERLAELTRPLLGAAFESGLLPTQSTLGIANVAFPAKRL